MSESEQDALLDKIETRRRRRAFGVRGLAVILCLAAMAIGIALVSGM